MLPAAGPIGTGGGGGVLIARWLRWERAPVAAHWRADVRRGFWFGVWLAGVLAAWLGTR